MQEVRFTKTAPWRCPSYKDYYIQEWDAGKDIYGHDAYMYALFRRCPFQVIQHFRTRKQAYRYVSSLTGVTLWDVKMGSYRIITNDQNYLGVLHNRAMYRITKRTGEVAVRPVDDEQLSGWYDKYSDCLSAAKQIVKNKEGKAT